MKGLLRLCLCGSGCWGRCRDKELNSCQLKVLGKIFDKGAEKFVGGINTKKYMAIAKTSRATAVRDLNRLLEYGCLQQIEATAGRNIRYELKL